MTLVPKRFLTGAAAIALIAGACSSAGSTPVASTTPATSAPSTGASAPAVGPTTDTFKPVTVEWWHIQNTNPMKTVWQQSADAYHAAHPNVTIKITVLENEAYKTKITTAISAGTPPDLFQSWGGGGLAEQVKAGMVKDVTAQVAPFKDSIGDAAWSLMTVDGKVYGVPYDMSVVGVWYNKSLFSKAGISSTPATWSDFTADITKLKAAQITPIAVGEKEKWPGMFWYAYLATRTGGSAAMLQAAKDGNFNNATFISAGQKLKELVDMKPFQAGFLGASSGDATGASGQMVNGKAAMTLMGGWEAGNENALKKGGLAADLGWFPFPTIDGAAGTAGEALGGGDGFAVGKNASPEAVDFLAYLSSVDVAQKVGITGQFVPVTKAAVSSVTDPTQVAMVTQMNKSTFLQLYLDQAYTPTVGNAVNDNVQGIFAGTATPEAVAQAITAAAKK